GIGKFASISGRYYAMDRDKRWERVQLAYDAVNDGVGPKFEQPTSVVEAAYEKEIYDEFVEPSVIVDKDGQPVGPVKDNDAMILFPRSNVIGNNTIILCKWLLIVRRFMAMLLLIPLICIIR